jgi:hypothetical protein
MAYIITLMSGRAHSWDTAVWEQQSAICGHLEEFMAEVRKVSGRKAASKQLDLHQNSLSVADYAVDFCTLVAESVWNPESNFDTFLQGLSKDVKDELAARELPVDSTPLLP